MSPASPAGAPWKRAAGWFVTPAEAAEPLPAVAVPRFAARVMVLGSAADSPPLAGALAAALRARERTGSAVVAVWSSDAGAAPAGAWLALPASRRLAARLCARGLAAAGRGRLAWLALPHPPAEAAAAAERVAGAVEVPVVLAVAGPRPEPLDALLDEQDLVVVALPDPDDPLARLALQALSECRAPVTACAPLGSGLSRALALAGLAGPRLAAEPLRSLR